MIEIIFLVLLSEPLGANLLKASQVRFESKGGLIAQADSATWNWGQRRAFFKGNVIVNQQETEMKAQEMTVLFGDDSGVLQIDAVNGVAINDGLRRAHSNVLRWHVPESKLVLSGQPSLNTEDGNFVGGKITIFRKLEEIRCEQGCRLEIKVKEQ